MSTPADAFRSSLALTFGRALGIVVDRIGDDGALAHLPFREDWLGDSGRGIIHTGLITTLVDSISGIALLGKLGSFEAIATLDLRMDYLRPALRDQTLYCRAWCYRMTAHIAFVQASVWQESETEPVAQSQSAFMRSSYNPRRAGRAP
jgi:uncharacterized protein (TIGR00369 family)